MKSRDPKHLWDELLRRRVVRTAVYYVAGAWVLAQAMALLLDAFDESHYMRYVVTGLVLGLPVVTVLAWMFDLTPKGIERTHELTASRDDDVPAALADSSTPGNAAPATHSVAVLPFANLSQEAGDEYFSDGLSEEIRNQL